MENLNNIIQKQLFEIMKKRVAIIEQAFKDKGVEEVNLKTIKEYKIGVKIEGNYEHYYLHYETPEQIRVISIQHQPEVDNVQVAGDEEDFTRMSYKQTMSFKYY